MSDNVENKAFGFLFAVGTLLTALVRQGDLSGIVQKICAYFVMQDLFQENSQNTETPFTSVLLNAGESIIVVSRMNLIEKRFVTRLLNSGTKDLGKFKEERSLFKYIFTTYL